MGKIKKNDIIEKLEITDITAEGNGVGHFYPDGEEGGRAAVFVAAAVPGDVIKCRIVKVQRSCFFGIIEELLSPSDKRCDRGCSVQKQCGGCSFRHISYEAELEYKENIVRNAFLRLGKFSEDEFVMKPVIGCEQSDRYRNKAQYPVGRDKNGNAICGFFAKRSHRVVSCEDCLLQPEIFSEITADILRYINENKIRPYDEESGKGLVRHIYLRRGFHSGEIMVCLVVSRENKKLFAPLADSLMKKYGDIRSFILNINPDRTNVIMGDRCVTLAGSDSITDIMCGNRISVSPLSFYQVNTAQAEKLYAEAAEAAMLTGREDVLDLYCGAGTIGLSMASKAGHITGAEIIPQAVDNARANAAANGITNADFICADAGEAAELLAKKGRTPQVIITDPPRKGCSELTLDSILKMSPERVVMISCNPATAARDCRYLADRGYKLKTVRAADLFPGAGHVECVCLLTKAHD